VTRRATVMEVAAERVRHIPAYQPGHPSPGPPAGKLSSNEAPLGPAPAVRAAVAAAAGSVSRYPEEAEVAKRLAAHIGVRRTQLLLTNGSDELCYLLAWVFLGDGRVAVAGDPCYQIDATVSLLAGATLRRVPLRGGAHDLPAMARAAQDAALVWLPSPHNPTGVAVDPADLEAFLRRVPASCMVVIDEAYRAFTDPALRPDVPRLLSLYPNLLVQRTLSKDWALAGLRIGYAIGSPDVIEALTRTRAPFSVSTIALAALDASLGEEAWRQLTVARVCEERARLEAELTRLRIEHFPSQANFVTARLDAGQLAAALFRSGIVIRPGDDLGMPGWVRITVGWAPQMAVLRGALRAVAGQAGTRAKE
jgi:histidinol-phosphate aminotransferase